MSKLERTSHILLIMVSVAALAAIARQQFFPNSSPERSRPELVGRHLIVPGFALPRNPALAVVVAKRSDCRFCVESLPLYRNIDGRRKAGRVPVLLYVVSSEPLEVLRTFFETIGHFSRRDCFC
jgi:hypothetical protein